jgi:flagellar biosynthetic protein FliQ
MNEQEIIDLLREAIWLSIKISAPIMLVGLIVGVTIALLQALTQVQEMTLVFVPKILAIFVAIFLMLPAFTTILIEFMNMIADRIVSIQ